MNSKGFGWPGLSLEGRPDETSDDSPPVVPPHKKTQTEAWVIFLKQTLIISNQSLQKKSSWKTNH
jgi:hypothetical protein